jgi:hypothetical protein
MINNKQVNIWRGTDSPPTEYHVWIREGPTSVRLLLFNGVEWVVFLDDAATIARVNELMQNVAEFGNKTINSKQISTNPVLGGEDLLVGQSGAYVSTNDSVTESILTLDSLFQTQIIE